MEACELDRDSMEGHASGLFPHPVVRRGQEMFLEDARMCMAQRTHLLAHAPTGLGKTAVALTAAVETAISNDGVVLFLTSRQSQHSIAVETLRGIWKVRRVSVVDLIAREDMCLAHRQDRQVPCADGRRCYFDRLPEEGRDLLLEYPLHVQEARDSCLRAGRCPYRVALQAAREASVIIGDYNQMFTRGPNLLQRLGRREGEAILIVDEGHNLPQRVMEGGSGRTTAALLRYARSSPELRHFAEDLDIIISSFERLVRRRPERILGEHLDGPLKRVCGVDAGGLAEELEAATQGGREYRGLIEFLHAWSAPDKATVRYLDGDPSRLVVSLIDPSLLASPVLSRVRCSLVMSGTLHPPEMFADVLGMRGAVCRAYPSPFPEENRVVLAGGRISSRYRSRGTVTYEMAAQEIAKCAGTTPGNVAVFFPSYEFMGQVERALASSVGDRKVLVERREYGKREREVVLGRLREGRNLLLGTIGGSYSEGVDFRDNILSMVIVVGLPLSPPSPEMEAMRELLEGKFGRRRAHLYAQLYPAVARVLQASGRAIRSETDRAAIVLLDDRYLIPQVRSAFPRDFALDVPGNIVESARRFYSPGEGVKGVDPNIADRNEPR